MLLKPETLYKRILAWAIEDERVQRVALTGSRATKPSADELADFDIQLYADDVAALCDDDTWWQNLAEVWVCVPTHYIYNAENTIYTRLVIYEAGLKVDFAIHPIALFDEITAVADVVVLLDKTNARPDGGARSRAQRADDVPPKQRPSDDEYRVCVEEFWFEAYHVAKYLKRGELWMAKFRDWSCKEFLLQMVAWHAQSQHNWQRDTYYLGKHIAQWAQPDAYAALFKSFGHFDAADSWSALFEMLSVFRLTAQAVAAALGVEYPQNLDDRITGFCRTLYAE